MAPTFTKAQKSSAINPATTIWSHSSGYSSWLLLLGAVSVSNPSSRAAALLQDSSYNLTKRNAPLYSSPRTPLSPPDFQAESVPRSPT